MPGTGGTPGTGGNVSTGGTSGTGAAPGVGGTIGGTGGQSPGTGGEQPGGGGSSTGGNAQTGGSGGGAEAWWFDGPRTPPELGTWPPPAIKLTEVVSTGVTQPTAIAAPRADTTRLFFTEKWGRVRLIKDGVLQETPALDIRTAVLEGGPQGSNNGAELMNQGKRGLVGLAFHPDYETNGRVFVMYTADQGIAGYGTTDHTNQYDDGDMTIEEYHRSDSNPDVFDPTPVAQIVQWDKGNCNQCSQHNGGSLEIDVHGFLWASSGDPPPYTDSGSKDLLNLNGKLLKFDISGATVTGAGNYPSADPMVASIGIRNAYKFSVDRYTGDIFVGDVGETLSEEITVQKYGDDHKHHGWPDVEGTIEYYQETCTDENCLGPVYEYEHKAAEGTLGDNCIIGGYVYRGSAIPALQGAYLYGDYGAGALRAIQIVKDSTTDALTVSAPHDFSGISVFMGCFGEDAAGELYVCDYNNQKILRVDAQ
jgi:glucose/arabinose dehydrogenase